MLLDWTSHFSAATQRWPLIVIACVAAIQPVRLLAEDWPQFRGPRGAGISESVHPLPVDVAPDSSVIRKSRVPGGHSSRVLSKDRIYVTAAVDDKLSTIALNQAGKNCIPPASTPMAMPRQPSRMGVCTFAPVINCC